MGIAEPYFLLAAAITSLVLAGFVYTKNRRRLINVTWSLVCVSTALWSFLFFLMFFVKDKANALVVARLTMLGAILLPPIFLHFTYAFTQKPKEKDYKISLFLSYCFAIFFLISDFTNLFVRDVASKMYYRYYWEPGVLFKFFILGFFIILTKAFFTLAAAHYKAGSSQERTRVKYAFIAAAIGFACGSTPFFLVYNVNIPPFGNYLVMAYTFIMTYAIVRHQLLDIQVVIKKTLVYSILVSILTIIYFITVYLSERLFSAMAGYQSVPLTIGIIAIFSIIFVPLKNRIQHSIDKCFFKGTIDQIEHEKHLLETELERSERLKTVSTLAAGMAHEIKNPLTSIKTFVEYVDKKYQNPEFKEKFKSIVPKEIDKITSIINQLLDYSKTDRISLKPCNIHSILDYVLDLHSNEFIKKHIKLKKEYNSQHPEITCDDNQLKQAFINIILNSMEAMPNGGSLTIETENIDNSLQISVKDTGEGIPEEKLKSLFDPFYTTKEKGTGLGLFIVHQIIENNKGKIMIDSEINKGTTIRVGFKK